MRDKWIPRAEVSSPVMSEQARELRAHSGRDIVPHASESSTRAETASRFNNFLTGALSLLKAASMRQRNL